MSPMIRFIIGLIRGMDGPDLEKLLTDWPAFLGEETGRLLKSVIDSGGTLSESDERELAEVLEAAPPEKPVEILAALLQELLVPAESADVPLTRHYLSVLNILTQAISAGGRPLVLAGFFHDPDCLTYWDFEPNQRLGNFRELTVHSTKIVPDAMSPGIYLLPDAEGDERLEEINLEIRKKYNRRLYAFDLPRMKEIGEFRVEFSSLGTGSLNFDIPDGAPGMLRMFETLPRALKAHDRPMAELARTLEQLKVLF